MPKGLAVKTPGGDPAEAEPQVAANEAGAPVVDVEAEVQRRLAELLPAAIDAAVKKATRELKLARQAPGAKIVMDMSKPDFDALTPEQLAAIKEPMEFRQGHYVPPGWPPTPEDKRADRTVERLAEALERTR